MGRIFLTKGPTNKGRNQRWEPISTGLAAAGAAAGTGAAAGSSLGSYILGGSAIMGGSQLAGGLLGGGTKSPKAKTTFSPQQKQMNQLIFDFLMGIERDAKGREISRNPLLTQMKDRPVPKMRKAPLTGSQKQGLNLAQGMMGKIGASRPDTSYTSQLKKGILPTDPRFKGNTRFLKDGGKIKPGESAIVGEAGLPEKIIALPKGGVEVIPNPKTFSSRKTLSDAISKSKKAERKFRLPAKALGTLTPKRQYGDYFLDYDANISDANYWDYDKPYTTDTKKGFEDWLGENRGDELWYKRLMGTDRNNPLFQTWGRTRDTFKPGDISSIPTRRGVNSVPYAPGSPTGQVHEGYSGALQEWWKQLPQVSGNTSLDTLLGTIPDDQRSDFGDWLTNYGQKYGPDAATNQYGLREGQYSFEDPYNVDLASLGLGINKYMTDQGYEQADGQWAAPNAVEETPMDWSGLLGQLTPDQYSNFNKYLENYQGGALADQGLVWNPETGKAEFVAPDNYYVGMGQAVSDFLGQPPADPNAIAGQPTPTTPTDTSGQIINNLTPLITGLATSKFDPTKYQEQFQAGVADPAYKRFEESTRPAIRETFGGGNLFGSAREKAELKGQSDLDSALAAKQAEYMVGAEEGFENRRSTAINQAMNLAKLPSDIAGQTASTDYKKAAAAGMFHDMELQEAVVNSNLDNQDIVMLQSLMSIYQIEQNQIDSEFKTSFINAMQGPYGFDWNTIMSLLSGYQGQSQIAYT